MSRYRATERCNIVLHHYSNMTGAKFAANRVQTFYRHACTMYREQQKVFPYN